MEKLNVSYYISERLVSKLDERSDLRSGNRSRQIADDLGRFYDMLDAGLRSALGVLSQEEIRAIINTIKAQRIPPQACVKAALMSIVGASTIASKISGLDDIACFALWDWACTNR